MCVRSIQPRLQAVVQGSIEAAAAADNNDAASSGTRRAPAAAAIVDVSRALCGLACSFLALHPDAHFSEDGCRELHSTLVCCLSEAQGRVVQLEQQRLLRLITAAGVGSAADAMDWLQSQPLDLLQIVTDVACALHRCCGGCRPKQVAAMVLECVKAIAALVKKNAQQHYDDVQQQVEQLLLQRSSQYTNTPSSLILLQLCSDAHPVPSKHKNSNLSSNLISSSASWSLFRLALRLIAAGCSSPSALSFPCLPPSFLDRTGLHNNHVTSHGVCLPLLSIVQRGRSRQL
jgi:hypothetical protein